MRVHLPFVDGFGDFRDAAEKEELKFPDIAQSSYGIQ